MWCQSTLPPFRLSPGGISARVTCKCEKMQSISSDWASCCGSSNRPLPKPCWNSTASLSYSKYPTALSSSWSASNSTAPKTVQTLTNASSNNQSSTQSSVTFCSFTFLSCLSINLKTSSFWCTFWRNLCVVWTPSWCTLNSCKFSCLWCSIQRLSALFASFFHQFLMPTALF